MGDLKNIRILVVDDDMAMADLIEQILSKEGYSLHRSPSIADAQEAVRRTLPDLILLDRNLTDGDGADFCQELKQDEKTKKIPILFLSGTKKDLSEKVLGLHLGGDDYIIKPFHHEELSARVKVVLRRSYPDLFGKAALRAGPLRLDFESKKAFLNKKELSLTAKEYDLLSALVQRKNRVLTREFLLQSVWGEGVHTEKLVDVTIGSLRKKLGKVGHKIMAIRGSGFRLDFEA
ncbi:MAG: response regulator transcription factor [Elusimicrobia bacterium]|nr:response regulator transcription factor [Elusimicrobiota bacterium]